MRCVGRAPSTPTQPTIERAQYRFRLASDSKLFVLNGVNAQPSAGAIAVWECRNRADARTGQYRPSLDAMQPRGRIQPFDALDVC